MPEIARFYGIVIQMYYNDHNPPHFHAKYGEYIAVFQIDTLELISGEMPQRAKALILEWAAEHRKELYKDWESARKAKKLKPIHPLV